MSLRACVAKAVGWTLEKANATSSQEASTHIDLNNVGVPGYGSYISHYHKLR